mmetsp:Transcript_14506/g.27866  ORF Transcript_14506/g.27866 Transcript_14506/m.27866 type:complete len:247 (-) Transcript_14506:96-836(-)
MTLYTTYNEKIGASVLDRRRSSRRNKFYEAPKLQKRPRVKQPGIAKYAYRMPVCSSSANISEAKAVEAVRTWVEDFIIGRSICPFAAGAMHQTKFLVSRAETDQQLEEELSCEMDRLVSEFSHDEAATTLFILPSSAALDFEHFVDHHVDVAQGVLEKKEMEGEMQVVPFHPHAEFSDVQGDPMEFVSRSPVPLLHLLRQVDVENAEAKWVQLGRNPGDITEANTAMLRGLGEDALVRMMKDHRWW